MYTTEKDVGARHILNRLLNSEGLPEDALNGYYQDKWVSPSFTVRQYIEYLHNSGECIVLDQQCYRWVIRLPPVAEPDDSPVPFIQLWRGYEMLLNSAIKRLFVFTEGQGGLLLVGTTDMDTRQLADIYLP